MRRSTPHLETTTRPPASSPARPVNGREALGVRHAPLPNPPAGHSLQQVPTRPRTALGLQAKLAIGPRGDRYEQEADRVSEQVVRMKTGDVARTTPPTVARLGASPARLSAPRAIQRLCSKCDDEKMQRKTAPGSPAAQTAPATLAGTATAQAKTDAVRGGRPLTSQQRDYFEPRFGVDFGNVRVHSDRTADAAARSVGALAYTRGRDIVFRDDQYRPDSQAGRKLLAHELTHVVQQGAAPVSEAVPGAERADAPDQIGPVGTLSRSPHGLQRVAGNGIMPPGDCSWAKYLTLEGSVTTAKVLVNTFGGCKSNDSCLTLALKIAAISSEIAARVVLDKTCFRGGNEGHQKQVRQKVKMLKTCNRHFARKECPPALHTAMAVLVDRMRQLVAQEAAKVAIGAVVAVVFAIIALAEAIAAAAAGAAAAAAEAAALAAAAAAIITLLTVIKDELMGDEAA